MVHSQLALEPVIQSNLCFSRNGKELTKTINIVPEYEEDTATLVVKKMSMDFDGDYKCVAENSAGTAETLAKVTVEGQC